MQLSNNTKYDFAGIELRMGGENQRVALKSMAKSRVIDVSYTTSLANLFGPGSLGLRTHSYSLNGVTISYPDGSVIMRNDLDEQVVNQIVIQEIQDEESKVGFRYILQ